MTLEELRIVISASTEPLRKEMENVKKQLSGMEKETNKATSGIQNTFKKLVGGIIALKIGQKIGEAIVGGIKEAMNVEAAIQQIKRIMGESSNQFLKWADTQAIAFNMSKGQAVKYGSIFGNLVSGFSSSTAEITKNTEDLLKASSVIASATGRTMDDVMERIRSGLLGNTEAIEDLGVNVNVAMIQSTEAFKKFANGKSWEQLDFQTQQQIRLMAILEQTTKKYGDAVNQNTSAQLAQLVAQLNNVKLSLGQAFLPIVQIILPVLTQFASGLAYVMNIVAQFSQALFGKSVQTSNKQAQGTQAQAKAMTNLGNATEKAGKQAKGALAGFDEINQLQMDDGSGNDGAGADGGTAITPSIDMGGIADGVSGIAPEIQAKVEQIKSLFTDMWQTISNSEAYGILREGFINTFNDMSTSLVDFYNSTLVPFGSWFYNDFVIPIVNDLASVSVDIANWVVDNISYWSQWLDLLLGCLSNFIDNFIIPIGDTIVNLTPTFLQFTLDVMNIITNLNNALTVMLDSFINEVINPFMELVKTIIQIGLEFIAQLWVTNGNNIITFVSTFIMTITDIFTTLSSTATDIIRIMLDVITTTWENNNVAIVEGTNKFINLICDIFTTLSKDASDIIKGLCDIVIAIWDDLFAGIVKIAGDIFNLILSTLTNIWNTINPAIELGKKVILDFLDIIKGLWEKYGKDILDNVSSFIKNVQDTMQLLWDNVLNPIIQPFLEMLSWLWNEHLKGLVEQVADFVLKCVNDALDLYNNFISPLIDWFVNLLGPKIAYIVNFLVDIFGSMIAGISDLIQSLFKILGGIVDFITGIFTGNWKKAWQGVVDVFGGIFDGIRALIRTPLNYIIDSINAVIRGLSSLKIDIPDWVPGFGGKTWGINIPTIPKLAKGGIVDSPTLAMIGEAGKEAVVPLENTSFVDKLASALGTAVMAAMQFSSGSNNNNTGDVIIQLDGTTLARVLNPYSEKETARIGGSMIVTT